MRADEVAECNAESRDRAMRVVAVGLHFGAAVIATGNR
jgi:hypothetical protein